MDLRAETKFLLHGRYRLNLQARTLFPADCSRSGIT